MRCYICSQPTTFDRCGRCSRPMCMEHVAMPGRWCDPCELEFAARRDKLRLGLWALVGVAVVVAIAIPLWSDVPNGRQGTFWAATTGFPKLDFLIIAGFAAYLSAALFAALRVYVFRARFLEERTSNRER